MPDDMRVGGADQRQERRVAATLPVTLDKMSGASAITRDVSATGLYFETDAVLAAGSIIHLSVEIETPTGKRILDCQGSIVRVESINDRLGCAVKILESRLVRP